MTIAATEIAEAVEAPATPTSSPYEFDESLQSRLLNIMMRDHQFASRTAGLVKPEFFTDEVNATLAAIANEHFERYREPIGFSETFMHEFKAAIAKKKVPPHVVTEFKTRWVAGKFKIPVMDREFLLDKAVSFAKNRAVEEAILKSAELVGKGDYAKIEKIMKEAMLVGENRAAETYEYYAEIENRTQYRKDLAAGIIKKDGITSGCPEFDKYLYHGGWGRKELTIMMAAAKGGKSMSLGDFAKSASLAGHKVIYFTLEVSARIISDRLDASLSDIKIKDIGVTPMKVKEMIEKAAAKAAPIVIEEYPSGTLKVSQVRRALDRYRSRGHTFDLIIVDYGDLMAPEYRNEDLRESLRQIFIDLRGIASEENAALLTATQTNRDGAKHTLAKATDVAEDFNKIRTADLILSINATDEEKARNEARIFFAASRNSEDGFVITIKTDRERMQFLKSVIGRGVP